MAKSGALKEDWSPFRAYAGLKSKGPALPDLLLILVLIFFIIFFYLRAANLPQYQWQWPLLGEFLVRTGKNGHLESGLLLTGLFTTLRVGFWIFLASAGAGFIVGALAALSSRPIKVICQIYINLARNTPPLVLLFCLYFFAGNLLPVGILEDSLRHADPWAREFVASIFAAPGQLDRMLAAIFGLGLYQAAYVAEIVRAGLESVSKGQWDAALALGFSRFDALYLVITPQACRLMLPPLTGQCITTFKDTALVSLISLPDLTFQSLEIMAITSMTFEIWISAAIIYLVIGGVCAIAGRALEKRYSFKK